MLRNSKLKTFVWYSGVGLLLLFAVAATLLRLYFSSLGEYRAQLETMAGNYLGQPVTISGMDARIVGIAPTVILTDVSLLQSEGESVLTRFSAVSISLDPVASLRNRSPIIELTVSGANLEVTRYLDGTLGVKGLALPVRESGTGEGDEANLSVVEKSKVLGAWFLSQNRLAVRDSHLSLNNEKSGERFSFDNVELELRNDDERHRLNGFVHLPKGLGKELRVAIDIEGNLLKQKDWSGTLYVKTEQLQSEQWLQQLSWQDSSLREGALDLELWSYWHGGELESLSTRLQATDLVLARGEQQRAIARLAADARLQRQDDGWRLDVGDLQIQHDDSAALPMRLALTRDGEELSVEADQLSLQAIATLLPYLPQLDERSQAMVRQMAPAGLVKGLYLRRAADRHVEIQGGVQGLTLQPWEQLPGVNGLDAQFSLNGDDGQLQLSGEEVALTLPRLFREPIVLQSLSGGVTIRREEAGWQLLADSILLANRDLSAQLGLELRLSEGSAPWLSLQGRFSAPDARAVPRYLPVGTLKEKSLYWLDNAFKAGRVPGGTLQYHGFLNSFPFNDHSGRFEVLFDAEAVQLHYHDGWPDLQQLDGEVHFDGSGMRIAARGARLFDAQLGAASVSIEDFHEPRLMVAGGAKLTASDGLRFLRESPLSKNGGKLLETMQGEGNVTLALQLALPLTPTVAKTRPLDIRGKVEFSGNRLNVIDGVSLHGLNGTLQFTEQSFRADKLEAQFTNQPVTLVVLTTGGNKPQVLVAARGRSRLPALRETLKLSLLNYLEGEAEWQMSLSLPRDVAAEGAVLRIRSNLAGVSSTLPEPLTKKSSTRREVQLAFYLSGARSGENLLTLGDDFGLVWRQGGNGEEQTLRRAQLRLGGGGELRLPARDVIEVVGERGRLSLARWREVLHKVQGEGDGARAPLPLVVAMQQLQLLTDSSDQEGGSMRVSALPVINFEVGQFAYGELQLGRVSVNMIPQGKQLLMKEIQIESDLFSLTGEGTWKEGGNTFFTLNLDSPNLGGMMQHLGFVSVFQGGKTHAAGKIWWAGEPMALTLGSLNAQLGVSIEKGTVVDVDPGAGRLLGILSVPALPRRLFLDFSDVFKKGFDFDSIKGDIRIEQGQAYTSNLRLESVPASILISGRTGLEMQDFDQDIYVVPNVSDTVSVASALAWGPQVAAVVVLLQEVFKSDIKAATMTRYHLSGSWREPVIQRIVEQQQKAEEPFFGQ
jgi:uncharacterized protein (TIGR02099 family)